VDPQLPRLDPSHPVVRWVEREVRPFLSEQLRPTELVVFDPPDRTAALGDRPPGLLIVSELFDGMAMRERLALVHTLLANVSPVRPFCLTPREYQLAAHAPGPVLAAIKTGVALR
jgi:hypothetical protein